MDAFFIIFAFSMVPVGMFMMWKIQYPTNREESHIDGAGVSIIIPARDEEMRLPLLLQSLEKQTVRPGEVIIVDDGSQDKTADVAVAHGARLIMAEEKPPGWVGKSWACWRGAGEAVHPILLFLDADVILTDDGLENVLATFESEQKTCAVQPYHIMKKPYEFLSAFFNIIVAAGLGAFTMAGKKIRSTGMFGPCMVCSKEVYFQAGGHESVRTEVVEDIALGKVFRKAGFEFTLFGGRGSVNFRMYPEGFRSMVEGWTKSMGAGAGTTAFFPLMLSILWMSGGTAAFILILRVALLSQTIQVAALSSGIYLLYTMQILWMLRRIGNFGILTCLFFPVHLMFFHIIFIRSFLLTLFKKEITWKGRDTRGGGD